MASMYVSIPTKGFNEYAEWRPASKIAKEEHQRLLGQFAHYMAKVYAEEVRKAIDSQKFANNWAPLSEDYLKFKRRNGLSLKIWEATSFLKDNITAYRSNDKYVVGVNKRIKYPTTEVPAWKVMFWMEFGTTKMPARPLFRPIATNLQKSIRQHWIRFLKTKGLDHLYSR
jgi:phage gpG-like protein